MEVLQEQGLSASGMPCNVTDEAQRQALFDFVVAEHGTLDSLILNQGATAGGGPLMDATESQWAKVMATNLVSPATVLATAPPSDADRCSQQESRWLQVRQFKPIPCVPNTRS